MNNLSVHLVWRHIRRKGNLIPPHYLSLFVARVIQKNGRAIFLPKLQHMKFLKILIVFFAGVFSTGVQAQTFDFECFCGYLQAVDNNCDICNPQLQSRYFKGILIRKDGILYKWIEQPYTVKFSGNVATFVELIPTPEQIRINMNATNYGTLDSFKMAISCPCAANPIEVDTPMIGDGTIGNPVTIGQFGADTTSVLMWNGVHWYPNHIGLGDILVDLPYYVDDDAAILAGLVPGDPYLLECGNNYSLPAGIYKVVKICGFDCAYSLKYFHNDAAAILGGIPIGQQYLVDETNPFGIQNGFVKLVTTDSILPSGTLVCSTVESYYSNDVAALTGGLFLGDLYAMSASNTYGAPIGTERAVSSISSTSADAPNCCDPNDRLEFFINDSDAITGGRSPGDWYYLSNANTLGFPYGTKKQIQ